MQANDSNGNPRGWLIVNRTTVTEIPGLSNNNNDTTSYAFMDALNNDDVVVGSSQPPNHVGRALIFIGGKTYDLNSYLTGAGCTQWALNSATDINNAGYIVGTATLNGEKHGFMLVPQGHSP